MWPPINVKMVLLSTDLQPDSVRRRALGGQAQTPYAVCKNSFCYSEFLTKDFSRALIVLFLVLPQWFLLLVLLFLLLLLLSNIYGLGYFFFHMFACEFCISINCEKTQTYARFS